MNIYSSHAYKEFPALFDIETLVSDLMRLAVLGMAGLFEGDQTYVTVSKH